MTWLLRDSWTLTLRALAHWTRQPTVLVIGLLFPVLMVVLFGYLLGGQFALPTDESYFELLLPGMFALTMVFGMEGTMTAVAADTQRGVTDRFRSMPVSGAAVLTGRGAADVLNAVAGLAVLGACGLLVGWRWHDGIGGVALALVLLLWLRVATVWVGVFLGLVVRDPQAVAAVQILVWPFGFLSGAFVSPASMPGWLGAIAEWNPLSATAAAVRELLGNPGWGGGSWAAQHAELLAVAWPAALIAVFVPLAVRRWRALDD